MLLDTLPSLRNALIYLAMCMSVPSLLLYMSECLLIVRYDRFRNSFYSLFVVRAISDLLYVLDSYYGYRLPTVAGDLLLPIYRQLPNWMLALFFFLTGFTLLANNLATAFILLNRLTAIALPIKHEKLWSKLLPICVAIIFLLPILLFYRSFGMDIAMHVTANDPLSGNRTSFDFGLNNDDGFLDWIISFSAYSCVIFLIVCMVLNVATLYFYRQKQLKFQLQKNANPSATQGNAKIEQKLLVYAVLTFVGHSLVAILMIGIYVSSAVGDMATFGAFNSHYPWVVDFGTVVMPSWLLFWASPTFRRQWISDFVPCFGKAAVSPLATIKATQIQTVVPRK